jgi:hypothetical protein
MADLYRYGPIWSGPVRAGRVCAGYGHRAAVGEHPFAIPFLGHSRTRPFRSSVIPRPLRFSALAVLGPCGSRPLRFSALRRPRAGSGVHRAGGFGPRLDDVIDVRWRWGAAEVCFRRAYLRSHGWRAEGQAPRGRSTVDSGGNSGLRRRTLGWPCRRGRSVSDRPATQGDVTRVMFDGFDAHTRSAYLSDVPAGLADAGGGAGRCDREIALPTGAGASLATFLATPRLYPKSQPFAAWLTCADEGRLY